MAIIKNTGENKCWQGLEQKKTQMGTATLENNVLFKKLKIELPCNPAVLFLPIYPKEMKTQYWGDICTPLMV